MFFISTLQIIGNSYIKDSFCHIGHNVNVSHACYLPCGCCKKGKEDCDSESLFPAMRTAAPIPCHTDESTVPRHVDGGLGRGEYETTMPNVKDSGDCSGGMINRQSH